MLKYILIVLTLFTIKTGLAQVDNENQSFNMFSCKNCKNKLFITSNSGIRATPFGLRIGFLCKTGAYLGTRFGQGKVYNNFNQITYKTNLFSITGGFIKPIFINNNFSSYIFIGGGYGQWWKNQWTSWSKNGYEVEGGLSFSFKKIMLNLSTNMLGAYKTYATWDFTVGLGYRFL